jgi:hypothetical protein
MRCGLEHAIGFVEERLQAVEFGIEPSLHFPGERPQLEMSLFEASDGPLFRQPRAPEPPQQAARDPRRQQQG